MGLMRVEKAKPILRKTTMSTKSELIHLGQLEQIKVGCMTKVEEGYRVRFHNGRKCQRVLLSIVKDT